MPWTWTRENFLRIFHVSSYLKLFSCSSSSSARWSKNKAHTKPSRASMWTPIHEWLFHGSPNQFSRRWELWSGVNKQVGALGGDDGRRSCENLASMLRHRSAMWGMSTCSSRAPTPNEHRQDFKRLLFLFSLMDVGDCVSWRMHF